MQMKFTIVTFYTIYMIHKEISMLLSVLNSSAVLPWLRFRRGKCQETASRRQQDAKASIKKPFIHKKWLVPGMDVAKRLILKDQELCQEQISNL